LKIWWTLVRCPGVLKIWWTLARCPGVLKIWWGGWWSRTFSHYGLKSHAVIDAGYLWLLMLVFPDYLIMIKFILFRVGSAGSALLRMQFPPLALMGMLLPFIPDWLPCSNPWSFLDSWMMLCLPMSRCILDRRPLPLVWHRLITIRSRSLQVAYNDSQWKLQTNIQTCLIPLKVKTLDSISLQSVMTMIPFYKNIPKIFSLFFWRVSSR